MEQEIKLLIINPGSTSTKISIFENGVERYKKSLSHPASEVARYARAADQAPFRQKAVEEFLAEIDYDLSGLTAIVARGGSLPPIHTGAYVVNDEMIDVLRNRPIGWQIREALFSRLLPAGLRMPGIIMPRLQKTDSLPD